MKRAKEPEPYFSEGSFPELIKMIHDELKPKILAALDVSNAQLRMQKVNAIIKNYDDYVTKTYSDHPHFDFTPHLTTYIGESIGEKAHALEDHRICDLFEYSVCSVSNDDKTLNDSLPSTLTGEEEGKKAKPGDTESANVSTTSSGSNIKEPHSFDKTLNNEQLKALMESQDFDRPLNIFELKALTEEVRKANQGDNEPANVSTAGTALMGQEAPLEELYLSGDGS